jgi:rRNA maturation protein Nop10
MAFKFSLIIAIGPLFYATAGHAGIFKCKGADGEVRFTDSPCGQDATIFKPNAIKKPDNYEAQRREKTRRLLDAYQEERRIKRENTARAKQEKETRRTNCNNARDRLRGVLNASRLYELDGEGNRVVYSDAQRDRATVEARDNVTYWCD